LEETQTPRVCPKCGGAMVEGKLMIPMERMSARTMNEMTPGFGMTGLPPVVEGITSEPIWEEKTGEKTGLIFKRDEVIQMKVYGYRCSLCNYIEIYAKPK
jgi:predicted nucleic-acid-binding Zn-ribbon protein